MTSRIDKIVFTGQSGRRYDFRLYVWATQFKAVSAVYVVTERAVEPNAAPTYRPVFVGGTSDLSQIFKEHPHQDCFDLYYANTVAVLQEGDEAARAGIEQDLVASLRPPCNAGEDV